MKKNAPYGTFFLPLYKQSASEFASQILLCVLPYEA